VHAPRDPGYKALAVEEQGEGEGRGKGEGMCGVLNEEGWVCLHQVPAASVNALVGPHVTLDVGCGGQLIPGTEYLLCITAVNDVGESAPSEPIAVATAPSEPPPPAAPTISDVAHELVHCSAANKSAAGAQVGGRMSVEVSWSSVRPHDVAGEVVYVLERSECARQGMQDVAQAKVGCEEQEQSAEWVQVFSGTQLRFVVEGLKAKTRYAWRLLASNSHGLSTVSALSFHTTPARARQTPAPPAPAAAPRACRFGAGCRHIHTGCRFAHPSLGMRESQLAASGPPPSSAAAVVRASDGSPPPCSTSDVSSAPCSSIPCSVRSSAAARMPAAGGAPCGSGDRGTAMRSNEQKNLARTQEGGGGERGERGKGVMHGRRRVETQGEGGALGREGAAGHRTAASGTSSASGTRPAASVAKATAAAKACRFGASCRLLDRGCRFMHPPPQHCQSGTPGAADAAAAPDGRGVILRHAPATDATAGGGLAAQVRGLLSLPKANPEPGTRNP
jgi:hypothetical protein